jgi:lysophospholipase L1-like esterase
MVAGQAQRRLDVGATKKPAGRTMRLTFATRHPRLANTLLVIASAAVAMLVVDFVAFYPLGIRPIGWGSSRFFQHSSTLGWEHRPYAEGIWYAYKDGTRTQVRINAYGHPDDDRQVEKTRPRIALIGDSTTEYWEVDEDGRPQRVMQRLLDDRVEVLNLGLRGAGTDQELILFQRQAVFFDPDIVVLTFCVNDYANNAEHDWKPWFELDADAPDGLRLAGMPIRGERLPAPNPWLRLLESSFTLRQLKHATFGIGAHFRAGVPLETHLELRPFKRVYDAEDHRRQELLQRLLVAFVSFARERGIHFLLVEGIERPVLDEIQRAEIVDIYGDQFDFDRVTVALEEHSVTAGYEFLSLPRLVRERGLDVRTLMHPHDSMHLNAAGAKLFSTAVIERIRTLGWLDERPLDVDGPG